MFDELKRHAPCRFDALPSPQLAPCLNKALELRLFAIKLGTGKICMERLVMMAYPSIRIEHPEAYIAMSTM